jgi:hypothetical protein
MAKKSDQNGAPPIGGIFLFFVGLGLLLIVSIVIALLIAGKLGVTSLIVFVLLS